MTHANRVHQVPAARRGTVYLIVLAVVAVVATLTLGALYSATSTRLAVEGALDASSARLQTESGLELGIQLAQNTLAWRKAAEASGVRGSTIMGNGSYAIYAADLTDSDIDDALTDPLVIQAFGYRNNARQITRVTLDPDWTPVSALTMALCAGGSVGFNTGSNIRSLGSIGANGSVVASSATVAPNIYAVGTITGGTYNGNRYAGSAAFVLPSDPAAHYIAVGASIPVASISSRRIEKQLLSPARNPYGATNAQGIYVIQCGGNDLRIRDARIVGTLVVVDSSSVTIEGSVFMEPAVAGYPVLITNNDLIMSGAATDLTEGTAGMNLNPASTPYKGLSDTDTSDTYPSVLAGLVYVGDDFLVSASCSGAIDGALIVNGDAGVDTSGLLTLFYRTTVNAPFGFVAGNGFTIRSGSWTRVVE